METGSIKFWISKPEIIKILKSLARGALYSVVTALVVIVSHLNVPEERAFLIPIIATMLTNLSLFIKKFVTDTTIVVPTPIPYGSGATPPPQIYGDPV